MKRLLLTALLAATLHAQPIKAPPAPVLSADEALKGFKLAPGFRIEIAAADPLVHDPVAMEFDADGRMWVVEMRAFMPNVDGKGEDAKIGRVAVLEDSNDDGRMDKRTDFLTGLQMPRALALVKGGVLVSEPPILWFCEDTDGDLKADKKTAVLKDYARQGPVEHTENGLMRGLDNWLYNAKSLKKLRFIDGKWVVRGALFRGQWGMTQDNYGRLYYNSNSAPLFGDLIPGHYTFANPHYRPRTGIGVRLWGSNAVWTSRVNPGINRGYQKHMLRNGHLAVWTGASGPVIYRGDQYPAEMVGDVFIPEPCGNMIRRQRITWQNGQPRGANAYDKAEWLTSTDERFRPVNMYNGPDGCLYIVDMYRGILQHRVYVTPYLRKQIAERKLDQPVGLGRIYRVVHENKKPVRAPKMSGQNPAQWVAALESKNGWVRDTAQKLLINREAKSAIGLLRQTAINSPSPLARQHALWTLEGLGGVDVKTVELALGDEAPRVRIAALRLTEGIVNDLDAEAKVELLPVLAKVTRDEDLDVRRQAALSLPLMRVPGLEPVVRNFIVKNAGDSIIRDGLVFGLGRRELEFLQRAAKDKAWDASDDNVRRILQTLVGCVTRERNAARIGRLLRLAAEGSPAFRTMVLDSIRAAAFTRGRPLKAVVFKGKPRAWAVLEKTEGEKLKPLKKFITWGDAVVEEKPPRPMTADEVARFALGRTLYQATCAACHRDDGLGEEGKAPPLLDSTFLTGPADRAIGIVLHGLTGPITVQGRSYNMTMPALQGFNDDHVAAILTYARRAWGHRAEPVTASDVARVKAAQAKRKLPWTGEELLKLK